MSLGTMSVYYRNTDCELTVKAARASRGATRHRAEIEKVHKLQCLVATNLWTP